MNGIISILIAARHDEDREFILATLSGQADFYITESVNDETGVIIKSERIKPDILIMDLQLNEKSGPELVRIIRRRSPSTAIIIICDKSEITDENRNLSGIELIPAVNPVEIHASLAIKAGISGFLLKGSDIDILTHIIREIYKNGCYINPSINSSVIDLIAKLSQIPMKSENSILSRLEYNIILLLAHGFSDAQIAGNLNYNIGTIRNCITHIRQKVKIKSRIEIVIYLLFSGHICIEHLCTMERKEKK